MRYKTKIKKKKKMMMMKDNAILRTTIKSFYI